MIGYKIRRKTDGKCASTRGYSVWGVGHTYTRRKVAEARLRYMLRWDFVIRKLGLTAEDLEVIEVETLERS